MNFDFDDSDRILCDKIRLQYQEGSGVEDRTSQTPGASSNTKEAFEEPE